MSTRPSFATIGLPDGYRQWNEMLIDELFPAGRAGVRVYLSVYEAFLTDCAARHGRGGRDDFIVAVRSLTQTPGNVFVVLDRWHERWVDNHRSGPPPFVAALALAVLAANDMETDTETSQANYYFESGLVS